MYFLCDYYAHSEFQHLLHIVKRYNHVLPWLPAINYGHGWVQLTPNVWYILSNQMRVKSRSPTTHLNI